jgi:hypothetical protein
MSGLTKDQIEEMFRQVDRFSVIEYRQVLERQVGKKKPADGMKLSKLERNHG